MLEVVQTLKHPVKHLQTNALYNGSVYFKR
jgi:hypothetical protein